MKKKTKQNPAGKCNSNSHIMWNVPQTVGCLAFKNVLIPTPERKCANEDFFLKFAFPCCVKIATDFPSVLIVLGILSHIFLTSYIIVQTNVYICE